jgi:hypothetical protein
MTLDNNQDDSSRLSTEFYEEYYRLLNSLKKGESRAAKGNSPKATNTTTILASPRSKKRDKVTLFTKIPKQRTKSARKHMKGPRRGDITDDSRIDRRHRIKERAESAPLEKRRKK